MSDQRLDRMEQWQHNADERFDWMGTILRRLDGRLEALHQRVGVLHEDLKADIAAMPGHAGATRAELAALKQVTAERIDPIEAAVRQHTREISALKRRR
jgi:hypothetical protein